MNFCCAVSRKGDVCKHGNVNGIESYSTFPAPAPDPGTPASAPPDAPSESGAASGEVVEVDGILSGLRAAPLNLYGALNVQMGDPEEVPAIVKLLHEAGLTLKQVEVAEGKTWMRFKRE